MFPSRDRPDRERAFLTGPAGVAEMPKPLQFQRAMHRLGELGFSPSRVWAMLLRYLYILRSSWPRTLELLYWPTLQMLIWGFMSQFLAQNTSYVARAFGVLLAAVMLWDLLFRSQLGLSISFLEEMWSRNLGQLFVTPLRPYEWLLSLLAMSVIRVAIGVVPAMLLAIPLYHYSVFDMGLALVAFIAVLMAMGWALGLAICGGILRHGMGAESLAWTVIFAIAPLSCVYYPLTTLPEWLRPIAWALPSTHVFEGMRAVLFEHVFRTDYFLSAVALDLVYLAVGATIFFIAFRDARRRGACCRWASDQAKQRRQNSVEPLPAGCCRGKAVAVERHEPALDQAGQPRPEQRLDIAVGQRLKAGPRDPLDEPQPHHDHFLDRGVARDRGFLLDPDTRAFDRGEPCLGTANLHCRHFPAAARHAAMRAGADAEIIPVTPIDEIVAAFGAGPGMVRDLIGRQPGRREPMLRQLEQRRGGVLVGRQRLAARGAIAEGGARLDRQLVERQMLAGERQRLAQLLVPGGERLAGPRIDQIERIPGKVSRARRIAAIASSRSCRRPRNRSAAGSSAWMPSDSRLTPAAANAAKRSASAEFGLASSVISRSGAAGHSARDALDQRRDRLGRHQRRRAAAEEDRHDLALRHQRGLPVEIGEQGARSSAPPSIRSRTWLLKSQYGHFDRQNGQWI